MMKRFAPKQVRVEVKGVQGTANYMYQDTEAFEHVYNLL